MLYHSTPFSRLAKWTSHTAGHPASFAIAVFVILAWIISGPIFKFTDTWQLVINTGTTIVTFLMVFLVQATQNRDSAAIQLKLDELIRATKGAHNALIDLEELEDGELKKVREQFQSLARRSRDDITGDLDIGTPDLAKQ